MAADAGGVHHDMTIDTSLLWRKVLAIAPRWARYALVASLIVGECLHVVAKIFAPVIDSRTKGVVDLSTVAIYDWPLLGLVATMPIAFFWHVFGRAVRGQTSFERAEEYIAILKMAAAAASLSAVQSRSFWSGALSKLAQEFSVGSMPPDPKVLAAELAQKDTPQPS